MPRDAASASRFECTPKAHFSPRQIAGNTLETPYTLCTAHRHGVCQRSAHEFDAYSSALANNSHLLLIAIQEFYETIDLDLRQVAGEHQLLVVAATKKAFDRKSDSDAQGF